MKKWQRIVIIGMSTLSILFIAIVNLGGVVVDIIIDDGCEVDAVDILPDIGDMHHYNITLSCEDGYKMMEVLTKDSPPQPGEGINPLRDSTMIPSIAGGTLLVIGLFLLCLLILECVPVCRKKGLESIFGKDNSLGHQLLGTGPEMMEV